MGKRTNYDPYDHFIIRAPLFPIELLYAVPNLPEELFHWLKLFWQDPLVRECILLGSFDFSQLVDREFDSSRSSIPETGLLLSLLRYLCRFSSRCTPFGTFAGFATGTLGEATSIRLNSRKDHELHARPDMEYLMMIARFLQTDKKISEKLLYKGNTSLYRVGARWHYVEVRILEGKHKKSYDIITINDNGVIGKLLEFCVQGKLLGEITDYLQSGGWEEKEVIDFVGQLVESQVLVSSLEPVICGPEYLQCLTALLGPEIENNDTVKALVKLQDIFDSINKPGTVLINLPKLDSLVNQIPVKLNRNHLIQVDMRLVSSSLSIDSKITGEVLLGLRIMKALSAGRKTDVLKGFRDAFIKRYGDRKILLVKALDPETGIGLDGKAEGYWTDPVPWIDDLAWGPSISVITVGSDPGKSWLSGKLYQVIRDNELYFNLDASDLKSIDIHAGVWPSQLTAMVELFETGISGELNIHLLSAYSGNPAFLLGRFGFADPNSTRDWITTLIEDEASSDPDTIFAEVVHLPEDRTGNVLQRPAFHDYEIPYLANSYKQLDYQIPVTDLLISVENDKMVLSSATSGKRIHPKMTNAYNHQLGHLSMYKFLHRISYQDFDGEFSPDWGDVAYHASFIPGIRFKNLILSAPVWLVKCEEISKWFHTSSREIDLPELLIWKNNRLMPDEMLWMASDQELYFNWTNKNLIMALWESIHGLKTVKMRPFYFPKGSPVKSAEGSYANQIVFCYKKS